MPKSEGNPKTEIRIETVRVVSPPAGGALGYCLRSASRPRLATRPVGKSAPNKFDRPSRFAAAASRGRVALRSLGTCFRIGGNVTMCPPSARCLLPAAFLLWISSFFRHSSFVIRHFPRLVALFLMITTSPAATKADPQAKSRLTEVQKILREVPLIDGHNDLPWQYHKRSNDLSTIDLNLDVSALKPAVVTDIPRLRAGGVGGQFWSVYVPATLPGPAAVPAGVAENFVVPPNVAEKSQTLQLALA